MMEGIHRENRESPMIKSVGGLKLHMKMSIGLTRRNVKSQAGVVLLKMKEREDILNPHLTGLLLVRNIG